MRQSLRGKVAIVTGASSGLGWATVKAFAAEGVRVVATARREERLRALAAEVEQDGGECAFVVGDAADPATAEAAVAEALQRFGRVDVLVNNAGQGNYKQMVDTTVAEYDELMDANMRSSFVFSRVVAPHLVAQRAGAIVMVSSVAGLAGTANEAVYSASKFAQVGFAESLAEELRPYGVKVCALCAGGMKTEFAVGRGRTTEGVASSRMMDSAEVADTILLTCMLPPNIRIPQIIVRHMGEPR